MASIFVNWFPIKAANETIKAISVNAPICESVTESSIKTFLFFVPVTFDTNKTSEIIFFNLYT